jgi:hypothetical protein
VSPVPGVQAIALQLTDGRWYKVLLPPELQALILPPDQLADLHAAASGNLEVDLLVRLELTPSE